MNIVNALPAQTRHTLRNRLHKVAAVMSAHEGFPIANDEVTIKEASYLVGVQFFKNYLEKQAMFDGILNVMQLPR